MKSLFALNIPNFHESRAKFHSEFKTEPKHFWNIKWKYIGDRKLFVLERDFKIKPNVFVEVAHDFKTGPNLTKLKMVLANFFNSFCLLAVFVKIPPNVWGNFKIWPKFSQKSHDISTGLPNYWLHFEVLQDVACKNLLHFFSQRMRSLEKSWTNSQLISI